MKQKNTYIGYILKWSLLLCILISSVSLIKDDVEFSIKAVFEEVEFGELINNRCKDNSNYRIWNDIDYQQICYSIRGVDKSKNKPFLNYIPKKIHSKLIKRNFLTSKFSTTT